MSLTYLAAAVALLAICITLYLWTTPYPELQLVKEGNMAAALSLGGATFGLTLPIASAIYFSLDFGEMMLWSAIGCAMQLVLFLIMRRQAKSIETGNVAAGFLLACLSVSTGVLVALSTS